MLYLNKRLVALMLLMCCPGWLVAQGTPEKREVHIAVGGKASLYYLPLTIA